MIESLLALIMISAPSAPSVDLVYDGWIWDSEPVPVRRDAPACTFRECNNYIGRGCRPFSSWLLGKYHIQVGCSAVTYGQIGDASFCVCHCYTGGELPSPCRVDLLAAPGVTP